ncbi:MAG: DUF1638 domain-containing protein [Planctomycetia bacterium]|nr:DUF1638 domain-containing protein [Planctomycetia bacterium]
MVGEKKTESVKITENAETSEEAEKLEKPDVLGTPEIVGAPEMSEKTRKGRKKDRKRFCLLACEIFRNEVLLLLESDFALSEMVDVRFLPKGLHDVETGVRQAALREAIQDAEAGIVRETGNAENIENVKHTERVGNVECVENVEGSGTAGISFGGYEAILLGYGLCSGGIIGLSTQKTPLVVPRVHDCVALFFGSSERYEKYFFKYPGTYFQTAGWQELGEDMSQFLPDSFQAQCGAGESLESFCEKYGPENGPYLWRELGNFRKHYTRLAFLKTRGEMDAEAEKTARKQAEESGWEFDLLRGDLSLLTDLLRGNWDTERFLVLMPGQKIRESYHSGLIQVG